MLESLGIHTVALDSAQDAIQLLETGVHFDFRLVDFDLSIINGPEVSTILFKIFSLWHFNQQLIGDVKIEERGVKVEHTLYIFDRKTYIIYEQTGLFYI